jgi:transposase InsO family protein
MTSKAAAYPLPFAAAVTYLLAKFGHGIKFKSKPRLQDLPVPPWVLDLDLEAELTGCVELVQAPALVDADASITDALAGQWRPALLMAQLRDPWIERMGRVLRWCASKGAALADFGLTAEDAALARESEYFELAADGLLLRRRAGPLVLGEAAAVPVLPARELTPPALAPGGVQDGKWSWRHWALYHCHCSVLGGHLALERSLPRLSSWVWWRGMSKDLARYVQSCPACAAARLRPHTPPVRSEHRRAPFQVLQVDLQGPIVPPSDEGFRFIVTVLCPFSRYIFLRGARTKTALEIARVLLDILWDVGTWPRVLQSDRGSEFVNAILQECLNMLQIRQRLSPAYSPHVQGAVERSHRSVSFYLGMLVRQHCRDFPGRWGSLLPVVQFYMRHAVIDRSGITPFQVVHGWAAASPEASCLTPWADLPEDAPLDQWVRELLGSWNAIHKRFSTFLDGYEDDLKRKADRDKRVKVVGFKVGDRVYLERGATEAAKSLLFLEPLEGPFVVTRIINDYRVALGPLPGGPTPTRTSSTDGVAVGRVVLAPEPSTLHLDGLDAGAPTAAVPGPELPPLSEATRRVWVRLQTGSLVLYRRGGSAAVGEVRQNLNRRNVLLLHEYTFDKGVWHKVFLDADGVPGTEAGLRDALTQVPYGHVLARVRLLAGGAMDATSARALHASRLPEWRLPAVEAAPPVHAAAPEAVDLSQLLLADVCIVDEFLSTEAALALLTAMGEVSAKKGAPEGAQVRALADLPPYQALPLSSEVAAKVAADEIVFLDRSSDEYAAYVAFTAAGFLEGRQDLSAALQQAVLDVAVLGREALWLPGAGYTRLKGVVMDVDTGDAAPISQQPYRRGLQEAEHLRWHVAQSLRLGILRPHTGAWSTPCFIVRQSGKPRGRLVADYRQVNAVTKPMSFPMPVVHDLVRRCSGHEHYSAVDAVSGFSQLDLTARAQDRLAIVTDLGTFAWTTLPFGPRNGPAAFQSVMSRLFANRQGVAVYVDDIVVYGGKHSGASRSA